MRKFILVALSINALLLAGRFWQEWRHVALAGGGLTAEQNGDVNGDARLDMSDAVYLLLHMFRDGPEPVALADSPELLERVARLEERIDEVVEPGQRAVLDHLSLVDLDDGQGGLAPTVRLTLPKRHR